MHSGMITIRRISNGWTAIRKNAVSMRSKEKEKIRTLSRCSTSQTKNRKITNWIPKKEENSVWYWTTDSDEEWRKYKKEKDIAGKSKKRDACDAGLAAVFGDFADESGDGKGTPGAERYFCFRARFRSAKNAAVLSSVIPQALSPH